jgi:hypothetical protein
MNWTTHKARVGGMVTHTKFCVKTLKEKDYFEELGADVRVMLKWMLKLWT